MADLTLIQKFNIDNPTLREAMPSHVLDAVEQARKSRIISPRYPYSVKMGRKTYEKAKTLLQIELVKLQRAMQANGERLAIVFEGRDAAGKGGTIKRFMEHLNPRHAHVVALAKPTETEQGQWYFQRYVRHLPTHGQMVFFDRSWYNRAGVERVMGFCTDAEYARFMRQAPTFETMLIENGTKLVKFWFSVSREEQLRRFLARAQDPLKQWKLSDMDFASLARWDDYTGAKEAMFHHTDTVASPWVVIRSDDKKRARLNAIRYVLDQFDYPGKNTEGLIEVDPLILGSADVIYEPDELRLRERIRREDRAMRQAERKKKKKDKKKKD